MNTRKFKMIKKVLTASLICFILSACTSNQIVNNQSNHRQKVSDEPSIISSISKEIVDYAYEGYHVYPSGYGYSLRYRNLYQDRHYADIYVWPVNQGDAHIAHKDLVDIYSQGGVADIFSAQDQGRYSSVKVLSKETFNVNGKIVSKHTLSYNHSGVPVFSYLFISEFDGELLKARLTFKNTPRNRKRKEYKEFVSAIFKQIMQYKQTNKPI